MYIHFKLRYQQGIGLKSKKNGQFVHDNVLCLENFLVNSGFAKIDHKKGKGICEVNARSANLFVSSTIPNTYMYWFGQIRYYFI